MGPVRVGGVRVLPIARTNSGPGKRPGPLVVRAGSSDSPEAPTGWLTDYSMNTVLSLTEAMLANVLSPRSLPTPRPSSPVNVAVASASR